MYSEGKSQRYETSFSLNPQSCTEDKNGVDFFKYCTNNSRPTTTTASTVTATNTTTDSSGDGNPALLIAGAISGLLVLLLVIVVVVVVFKRKTTKKNTGVFKTDENYVYGTYSRGSKEDGEYGDGDVVEVIDTNDYYGS